MQLDHAQLIFIIARRRYASAKRGIGDRNSIRASLTCALCDKTKEHTADILIQHERVITLVFLTSTVCDQQRLVGDVPTPQSPST